MVYFFYALISENSDILNCIIFIYNWGWGVAFSRDDLEPPPVLGLHITHVCYIVSSTSVFLVFDVIYSGGKHHKKREETTHVVQCSHSDRPPELWGSETGCTGSSQMTPYRLNAAVLSKDNPFDLRREIGVSEVIKWPVFASNCKCWLSLDEKQRFEYYTTAEINKYNTLGIRKQIKKKKKTVLRLNNKFLYELTIRLV